MYILVKKNVSLKSLSKIKASGEYAMYLSDA